MATGSLALQRFIAARIGRWGALTCVLTLQWREKTCNYTLEQTALSYQDACVKDLEKALHVIV